MAHLEFSSPETGFLLEPLTVVIRGAPGDEVTRVVQLWTDLPSTTAPQGGIWHAETAVWTRPPATLESSFGAVLEYRVVVIPTALGEFIRSPLLSELEITGLQR